MYSRLNSSWICHLKNLLNVYNKATKFTNIHKEHPIEIDWFEFQIFHCSYPGRVKLFLTVGVISADSDFCQYNIIKESDSSWICHLKNIFNVYNKATKFTTIHMVHPVDIDSFDFQIFHC